MTSIPQSVGGAWRWKTLLRLACALLVAAMTLASAEAHADTAVVLEVDGPAGRMVRRAAMSGVARVATVANAAHARAVARRLGVELSDVGGCSALARELDASFVLLGAVQGRRVALVWIGPSGPLATRAARLPRGGAATRRFSAMVEATTREVLEARSAPPPQPERAQRDTTINDGAALDNIEARLNGRGGRNTQPPPPAPAAAAPQNDRPRAQGSRQTLNEVDALIATLDAPPEERRPNRAPAAEATPAPTTTRRGQPQETTSATSSTTTTGDPRIRAVQNETARVEESRQDREARMRAEREAMEAERRERAERDRLELRVQERDRALARREQEMQQLQERLQREETARRQAEERAAAERRRVEEQRRTEAESRRNAEEERRRAEREEREERQRAAEDRRRGRDDDREDDRYRDDDRDDRDDRQDDRYGSRDDRRDDDRRSEDDYSEEDARANDDVTEGEVDAPAQEGLPPEEYYELLEEHYELLEEREDEEEEAAVDNIDDDRRRDDDMVGDDLDDFLEDDLNGGEGEVPPTFELMLGFGMRARTSDVFRSDGSGERVATGLFPEITFDARFRPLAEDANALSFLFVEVEGGIGLGASTLRQTAAQPIGTFPYRGRALVGYQQRLWRFDLGARLGFGLEGFSVDAGSPLTSSSYAYLLFAGHVRFSIIDDWLGVKLGAGLRPVISARGLDPGAQQSATALGFEFNLGVSGTIADIFIYDVALNYQRYGLGFGPPPMGTTIPPLASGYDLVNGFIAQGGVQF